MWTTTLNYKDIPTHSTQKKPQLFGLKKLQTQRGNKKGLAHKEEHAERYLSAADNAFKAIAQAVEQGDISEKLKGKPSQTMFKRIN